MPQARLIDLTRLASRLGLGAMTGIDRVEYAWARHLSGLDRPLFGLIRTRLGFALLNAAGIAGLLDRAAGLCPVGPVDLTSRLIWRRNPARGRAEADVRRLSMARASVLGLPRLLARVGVGFSYFNLGHSNLTPPVMRAVKAAQGCVTVLLHDTIPLDHPEFTRAGIPAVFGRKLGAVSHYADLVIHTTQAARRASEAQMQRLGRVPPAMVANLGVTVAPSLPGDLPPGIDLDQPFVLALGTIEPRKNLELLCDVWDGASALPRLCIVGHRGWADPALFARLSALPGVEMLGPLSDGAVGALMDRAVALVFPTLAEGFGLPPLEAAARGLPVICSDLAVLHELLHDFPVYLNPRDVYSWRQAIQTLAQDGAQQTEPGQAAHRPRIDPPLWEDHFNAVLSLGL